MRWRCRCGGDEGAVRGEDHNGTVWDTFIRRGRKQVTNALHTCTVWYAYVGQFVTVIPADSESAPLPYVLVYSAIVTYLWPILSTPCVCM